MVGTIAVQHHAHLEHVMHSREANVNVGIPAVTHTVEVLMKLSLV